eukprot:SAG11_NODE_31345_length_292_cov_1.569948_1_plen_26_part_10
MLDALKPNAAIRAELSKLKITELRRT